MVGVADDLNFPLRVAVRVGVGVGFNVGVRVCAYASCLPYLW